eukprot:UC4_evm3s261
MTLRANTNSSSGLSDEFEDMHILKQSAVTKGIETALIEGWTWGKGEDEGGEDKALALSCSSLQRRYSARAETLKNIRRLRMVDVTVQQLIGTGHSGKVYRGTLYDSSTFSPDTVAIKQLKVGEDKAESRVHFLQEATFMAQMDHKNVNYHSVLTFHPFLPPQSLLLVVIYALTIFQTYLILITVQFKVVNFIGVVAETVPWMIVTEFMANGSVKDYLTRNGSQILTVDRVRMGRDIAFGMEHIGKHHFVHRDLALRNCLLDAYLNVKISDFGLTRALSQGKGKHQDEEYYCNTTTRHSPFPIRWTAPEVLSSGKFTSHSDMWSYGITLWELFSDGQTPYADKHGKWELLKVAIKVSKGYRLDRPAKCPKPIYVMMLNLWCDNPRCRPHSSEVGKMMDRWYQLHSMRSQSSDADLTHQGPRLRKHVSRGSIPNLEVSIGELGSEEMGEKELSLDLCGSSAHEKNEEDTNTPEKVDTLQHDLEPKIQRSSFGRQESVGKLEN